jgi:hypothetical protein
VKLRQAGAEKPWHSSCGDIGYPSREVSPPRVSRDRLPAASVGRGVPMWQDTLSIYARDGDDPIPIMA